MRLNVKRNAKRNLAFGVVNKVVLMIVPFVVRTAIKNTLGVQYLGLNSLFSSILQVLSVTEMGFSTAVIYNMYKPISEGDDAAVCALLNFYRKVYRIIGLCVLAIGFCLIPFLPHLISGSYPEDTNITVLYLIYLINSVVSYFLFAYLSSLLVAYQREDVNSIINLVVHVGLQLSQIAVLYLTRNYYLFIILMPVFTIINNIWIAYIVKRMYPQYKCEGNLPREKIGEIKKLVEGTFIQKACSVTRNSLDSICISAFLGLTLTGIYNNYYSIYHSVTTFIAIVGTSLMGGIGNHVATKSARENFEELETVDFLYMTLSGWCCVFLLCLSQPFMTAWMGKDMLLPFAVIIEMCLYFYVSHLGDMKMLYTSANGLWWHHRWRSIIETLMNLGLNVGLGKLFGVYGIVAATIISLLSCNFIWGTKITFKLYFKEIGISKYFQYQGVYFIVNLIVCTVTYVTASLIIIKGSIMTLAVRAVLCAIIPAIMYFIIYRKYRLTNRALKYIVPKRVMKRLDKIRRRPAMKSQE